MLRRAFITALVAISGSTLAVEGAEVLAGNKLRKAVSGKTVYLMTSIGAEIRSATD
jgi:hypothetical protein